jgi:hypothetical protein
VTSQEKCDSCVMNECRAFRTFGARALEIKSEAYSSTLELLSGGSGSSAMTLMMTNADGTPATSFSLINTGKKSASTPTHPTLRVVDSSDTHAKELLVLTARPTSTGALGDLLVAGSFIVGELNTTKKQQLAQKVGPRGGDVTLRASSGPSHDTSVVIQSGPNQRAMVKLTDPGDGQKGSAFWIFNDGAQGLASSILGPESWGKSSVDSGMSTMRITVRCTLSDLCHIRASSKLTVPACRHEFHWR